MGSSWRAEKLKTAERGYGWRWQLARADYLSKNPLCVRCKAISKLKAAGIVDHIKPHRGDPLLFWDRTNWQSLCKSCHDSHKQSLEKSGKAPIRVGEDGFPIDE